MAMPAYHAVQARQALHRPNETSQPASQTQTSPWTPEVREYVQRALGTTIPGVEISEMQEKLKAVITGAAETGKISLIDWTKYPLPQHMILQERAQAAFEASQPPNLTHPLTLGPFATTTALGKRKSSDLDMAPGEQRAVTPPWKKPATKANLADRISGKSKTQEKKQKKAAAFRGNVQDTHGDDKIEKRRQRFGHVSTSLTPYSVAEPALLPSGPVIGTCQKLEKNYFRLTSAPKSEEVRPLPVLREMMNLLRKKWKNEHSYTYACDQFKSLRQDLTVQHIKNEFTVQVYEAHARIALEMGDMGEYNQCQTQLKALYKLKLGGKPEEFTAYRILYFIYTCNRADMNDALADLSESDKQMEGVKHALQVRAALASGNYHRFFKLYQDTPFMGAYLLDKCIARERLAAMAAICKTSVLTTLMIQRSR